MGGKAKINPDLRQYVQHLQRASHPGYYIKIESCKLRGFDQNLRGAVFSYRSHAIIRHYYDLNLCWTRFVVCKELMHLYAAGHGQRFEVRTPEDQINEALMTWLPSNPKPQDNLDSEPFALLMATEYMLPWSHRPKVVTPPNSNYKIADHFKLPEVIVQWWYASGWAQTSEDINKSLDDSEGTKTGNESPTVDAE